MARLPKFTLEYEEKKGKWALENDKTNRTIKTFTTKERATAGGGGSLSSSLVPPGNGSPKETPRSKRRFSQR